MDTIKVIDTQQKFANSVYLDFMSKRFGITPCCSGDVDESLIKKQLCDWQALDIQVPEIQSITSDIFIPSNPANPCQDLNAPDWCSDCSNNPPNAGSLNEQLLFLENSLSKLLLQKEEIEVEITTVTLEQTTITTQIITTQDQIAALQLLIQQTLLNLKDATQLLNQLEQQFDDECEEPLSQSCIDLQLQIENTKGLIQQLEELYEKQQSEEKALADVLNTLQEQLEEVNQTLEKLTAQLNIIISTIDETETQIKNIEAQFCVDDAECVLFEVVDSNGNPIKDYELYIDRLGTILTNALGQYQHTFTNASVDSDHSLQICYCFTTTGSCRQQKITLTIKAEEVEVCKDLVPCNVITISETIVGEEPAPVPPGPEPLNCTLPECIQKANLVYDETGQWRFNMNYNDIDDYKVTSNDLEGFNTDPEAEAYFRAGRDAYVKSIYEYTDQTYYGENVSTSEIECEPDQLLTVGGKYGFTNYAMPMGQTSLTYGFTFDKFINYNIADITSLPTTGNSGDVYYIENTSETKFWDPNTNAWVDDYLDNGRSVEEFHSYQRQYRDFLFKQVNEMQLAMDPFNWSSLYIPDFTLTKYF